MGATTLQSFPTPNLSDPPNGPSQILTFGNAIEKQTVMLFATAVARDAAITAPTNGEYVWLTTTKQLTMYDGAAWVIVYEPKQAWALTTISQGASTPTCTTTRGWSQRSGGLWRAHVSLAITSAGTAGSGIVVALPFTLANSEDVGGSFSYIDVGTATYAGAVIPNSTTGVAFVVHNSATQFGATPNFACANTDVFRIDLWGSY